jgi:hypothetical protein
LTSNFFDTKINDEKLFIFCVVLFITSFSGKQTYFPKQEKQTLQMLLDSLRHKENLVVDSSFKMKTVEAPTERMSLRTYCKSKIYRIEFSEVPKEHYEYSKFLRIKNYIFDLEQFYF